MNLLIMVNVFIDKGGGLMCAGLLPCLLSGWISTSKNRTIVYLKMKRFARVESLSENERHRDSAFFFCDVVLAKRTGAQQCRGNAERAAGGGSAAVDECRAVRAISGAAGLNRHCHATVELPQGTPVSCWLRLLPPPSPAIKSVALLGLLLKL